MPHKVINVLMIGVMHFSNCGYKKSHLRVVFRFQSRLWVVTSFQPSFLEMPPTTPVATNYDLQIKLKLACFACK